MPMFHGRSPSWPRARSRDSAGIMPRRTEGDRPTHPISLIWYLSDDKHNVTILQMPHLARLGDGRSNDTDGLFSWIHLKD